MITSLAVGGAQSHLLTVLEGLRDRFAMDVVYFKDPDLAPEVSVLAGRLTRFGLEHTPRPFELWKFAHYVKDGRYQIVHTHLLKADIWGAIVGRAVGVPVIVSTKHNCEDVLQKPIYGRIHGLLAGLTDTVIAVSSSVAEYMGTTGRILGPKVMVVHYGIRDVQEPPSAALNRVRTHLGIDQTSPLVLCVARLDPQKDHQTLLRAWKYVARQARSARLVLVGSTQLGGEQYVEELKALISALGIGDTVVFAGVRKDVPILMASCDILAMSSQWEGVGLVFLEAMRAGRPVVATKVGGIPEIVADGETGYLVDARDPAALGSSLLQLIKNRDTATTMGKHGRNRYKQLFSAEQMLSKMERLYIRLLAK